MRSRRDWTSGAARKTPCRQDWRKLQEFFLRLKFFLPLAQAQSLDFWRRSSRYRSTTPKPKCKRWRREPMASSHMPTSLTQWARFWNFKFLWTQCLNFYVDCERWGCRWIVGWFPYLLLQNCASRHDCKKSLFSLAPSFFFLDTYVPRLLQRLSQGLETKTWNLRWIKRKNKKKKIKKKWIWKKWILFSIKN